LIGNRRAYVYAVLGLLVSTLAVPAVSRASTGGASLMPSVRVSSPIPATLSGDVAVTATGGGVTLATRASGMLSKQLRFTGVVPSSDAGDTVEIERLGHETNWSWAPTVHATVAPDGSFAAVWRANHIGQFSIRALIERPPASFLASASATLTVTVYRPSIATWYGPGFYGRTTACGAVLEPSTLGTANRTLKCGTPVAIYYQGRTIVVPVIDRGPYANHADWDLTQATARAIKAGGVTLIGAVSLPARSGS
jgi:rare lipoprotein A